MKNKRSVEDCFDTRMLNIVSTELNENETRVRGSTIYSIEI